LPNPRVIKPDELTDPNVLTGVDFLILPSARSIPTRFVPTIDHYLKSGGRLIACGLPQGSLGVFKAGDKWMSRGDYERALAELKPQKILLRFGTDEVKRLERSTDDLSHSDLIESMS